MGHTKTALTKRSSSWLSGSRLAGAGFLALLATVAAVFVAPKPGFAYLAYSCDWSHVSCQTGVEVTLPPFFIRCETASENYNSTAVCVDTDGDYVYVRDNAKDDHSAVGVILSQSGAVTTRICRNPHGVGSWARCNFDWLESTRKVVHGGYRLSVTHAQIDTLWAFSDA